MYNVSTIGRNTNKITLKELCNIIDNINNKDNDIICSVKVNKDYRMPISNVDKYLHQRFEEKSKILCKR